MCNKYDIHFLITITGPIPLLEDYYSPLSLGLYLCWRTIILHYHWAYISAGGLLFSTITGPIPLLEDYYSPRVSSTYNHVIIIKTTILCPEA
jgi:hypothetical protein